jgi:uncharacterized protein (DUF1015 family)
VASPPYDVVDTAEARTLAAGNADSFLHVSRPEIDLPDGTDPSSEQTHLQGRAALADLVRRGVLAATDQPELLVYRQVMGDAVQTGVVACTSVQEYRNGLIATHEHTRPDKEADRARHIEVLDAHDEPVFLMYRPEAEGAPTVSAVLDKVTSQPPEYDLVCDDGIAHTVWPVRDPQLVQELVTAFEAIPVLYVADGHHRSAAAARVAEGRSDADGTGAAVFLSVVFPADQLTVMAYNRVVRDLAGHTAESLLTALADTFDVLESGTAPTPERHQVGMYLSGRWYLLTARQGVVDESDPIARLDVSVVQQRILDPLLGIQDPRTDQRVAFVGGIRGNAELERLVDSGRFAVAFSLHPTSPREVMDVADRGDVMPPKSTWFEPKLRSGLFLHPMG